MTTTPLTPEDRAAIAKSGLPGKRFRRGDDLFRVRYQRRSPRGWIVTAYRVFEDGPPGATTFSLGRPLNVLGVYPTPEAAVDAAADARSLAACDDRICTPAEFVKVRRENRLARARG